MSNTRMPDLVVLPPEMLVLLLPWPVRLTERWMTSGPLAALRAMA